MSSQKKCVERNPWRLLAFAAVLHVAAGAGIATAQTVMVRSAPSGATIELLVNATPAASAKADPGGDATLTAKLSEITGKTEIDANLYVDVCADDVRRVVIVERGQAAAPQRAGCDRRDTGALFLVRQVSTLVINAGGVTPTVVLRQGPVRLGPRMIVRAPRGLVLFGGGGISKSRDTVLLACGNLAGCSGNDSGLGYTAGVAFWITSFFAAEVSYIKPAEATAEGSGTNFNFNTALEADVVTIAAKVGVPLRRVRLFGSVGTNYHDATFSTAQTTGELSQNFELRTAGWGWQFGGGLEVWLARSFGIYAEAGRATLKGSARDGGEGTLDDRLTFLFAGARVRLF